jgi:DUF4097 and DUF4098 domain-containing protein YvlB
MKKFIVIVALCLSVVAPMFGMGKQNTPVRDSFRFNGISGIKIDGMLCDIEVVGTDIDEVRMEIKLTDRKIKVYREAREGLLRVWVERQFLPFESISKGENRILFQVPRTTGIDVNDASGNVDMKGLRSTSMTIVTASGSIVVESCEGMKRLTSASGNIRLAESKGDAICKSTTGNQVFTTLTGAVKTENISGNISFVNTMGNMTIKNTSGSVSVKKNEGDIEARTKSGRIEINDEIGYLIFSTISGEIAVRETTLASNSSFDTVSGSIKLELLNFHDCRFDLSTVSGSIHAGSVNSDKPFIFGDGGTNVIVKTASGAISIE